jgi:ABC-type phosphate transport system substrate-binding protein
MHTSPRAKAIWALPVLLGIGLALLPLLQTANADTFLLQGSSTVSRRLLETHQKEIEQTSGHKLTVIPSRSSTGIIALLEGRAQMAMISGPLQGEIHTIQRERKDLSFERLRAFELGRTRVAIAVHPSNTVRAATWETLAGVLTGQVDSWKTLGGLDLPIRIVLSGPGGGVTVAVESVLLKGNSVNAPGTIYLKSGLQVVRVVEQEPSAIAFAQLSLVKTRAIPEIQTEKPIEQVLSLVTLGQPSPAMLSVIDAMRNVAAKLM